MSADYTVKSVREGKVYDRNEHGKTLQAFYCDLTGPDGKAAMGIYWRREKGNAPKVGEAYHGKIEETQFGDRFKAVKRQESAFKSGGARSPQVQAEITRQHSQEMALRWVSVTKRGAEGMRLEELPAIVNWFDADVRQAGQAVAGQQAGGVSGAPEAVSTAAKSSPAAPPPSAQDSDQAKPSLKQLEFLEKLLKDNGTPEIGTIMEWANQTFTPGREGTCSEVIDRLKNEGVPEAERLRETALNWAKPELGLPGDVSDLINSDPGPQDKLPF